MGKKLGQHFLTHIAIPKRIIESAHIQPTDTVLEVGPGKGILTQFLVKKAKKVIAIEKDRHLARYLQEKYKDIKHIEIAEGDILKISSSSHSRIFNKIPKKYKVVANLPYYITSRFLRLFMEELENKPQSMTLMIQKEVAERICAKPPHMNVLALSVQAFGKPKILFHVAKGNFSPPPEVDSSVITIEGISDAFFKENHISPQEFFKLPKKAFSQKRKMLRSSISEARLPISETELPKFLGTKRPQELSLEDWISFISYFISH